LGDFLETEATLTYGNQASIDIDLAQKKQFIIALFREKEIQFAPKIQSQCGKRREAGNA
jgi:hypothetical protein